MTVFGAFMLPHLMWLLRSLCLGLLQTPKKSRNFWRNETNFMNDDPNTPEAPEEVAFNAASAGLQLDQETPLLPFSPARERAFQAMGGKMPAWNEEEFEMIRTGKQLYPGALRDTTIFMWLCSIPTNDEQEAAFATERAKAKQEGRKPDMEMVRTVQWADRNPDEAYEEACKFGDAQGIVIGSKKFLNAYIVMRDKGLQILESRFTIEGGEGSGDEPGNA